MNEPTRRHGKPLLLAWLLAAPMPVIGVVVVHLMSTAALQRATADFVARNPDLHACGLMALPYLVFGIGGGALVGVFAGAMVAGLVEVAFWLRRRRSQVTSRVE